MCLKAAACVMNNEMPHSVADQMPQSVASALGLHCLLKPVRPSTAGY